jgi:flagellin-like protein
MKTKSLPPFIFLLRNKKAISNLLAVVLLILITLVIGGLFFIFGRTMFHSLSTTRDFEILDANLLLDSSGNPTLQITIKNTGNGKITISGVAVINPSTGSAVTLTWASPPTLDVGQSIGKVFIKSDFGASPPTFTAGQKVIVRVSVTYDSNTIEKITQVVVQG